MKGRFMLDEMEIGDDGGDGLEDGQQLNSPHQSKWPAGVVG